MSDQAARGEREFVPEAGWCRCGDRAEYCTDCAWDFADEGVVALRARLERAEKLARNILDWDEYHGFMYSANNPNVRDFVEQAKAIVESDRAEGEERK